MTIEGNESVYRSSVRSIFADTKVLLTGVVANFFTILMTAYAAESLVLVFIGLLSIVIGAARFALGRAFLREEKRGAIGTAEFKPWERQFTIGSVAYSALLGIWCLYGSLSGSTFVQLVSVSTTFANAAGICGRSFAIKRLVNLQLLSIAVPIFIGMIYLGGLFAALAFVLIPFFLSLAQMASWQRQKLLDNIEQKRLAEELAARLDTTLNSVPQGICLFDEDRKLFVANDHVERFLSLSTEELRGQTLQDLFDALNQRLKLRSGNRKALMRWLQSGATSQISVDLEMLASSKIVFKFKATPLDNGSLICTFDNISDEVEAASRIDRMMRYDGLTGLFNRNQLTVALMENLASRSTVADVALLMVNLNKFKRINELHGLNVGDVVIRKAARRIANCAGDVGTCASLGGDEFAIIVSDDDAKNLACAIADSIVEAFERPMEIADQTMQLGCSIGIAVASDNEETAEVMLRHAGHAMRWARDNPNCDWLVFDREMGQRLERNRSLENELRVALENDELRPHYQPLIDVTGQRIGVCEALARWPRKNGDAVPPGVFIPIAEKTGMISMLGKRMLARACKDCASWPKDTRVAVNLSPLQFNNGDITDHVRDALEESGLHPARLELEITESAMLADMGEAIEKLKEFKRLGVQISLDDFGTGYSSLSYMTKLPIDKLKIDSSFVRALEEDENALSLLKAIAGIGTTLALKIVVEGVETTQELLKILEDVPVDEIQGYLFSKPIPQHQISRLLDKRSSEHIALMRALPSASTARRASAA